MLTLLAKGVPFEVVNINLENKPEWFLQQTWGTVSVVRYRKYLRIKIAKISDKLFFYKDTRDILLWSLLSTLTSWMRYNWETRKINK